MKFIFPSNGIRQFCNVQVRGVSVKRMSEILACHSTRYSASYWLAQIQDTIAKDLGNVYLFGSGAKLNYSVYWGCFTIYGYADGGDDILSAIAEIKCLDALREAKKQHMEMMVQRQSYQVINDKKVYPTLDVSVDNNTKYVERNCSLLTY